MSPNPPTVLLADDSATAGASEAIKIATNESTIPSNALSEPAKDQPSIPHDTLSKIRAEWNRRKTRGAFGGGKVKPIRPSLYALAPWERDGYSSEAAYLEDHKP